MDIRKVKKYLETLKGLFLIRKVTCDEQGVGRDFWSRRPPWRVDHATIGPNKSGLRTLNCVDIGNSSNFSIRPYQPLGHYFAASASLTYELVYQQDLSDYLVDQMAINIGTTLRSELLLPATNR